jgi:hypothetical protein
MTIVLVGSRAAIHHWPEFRKPKDVDVVCTLPEALELIHGLKLVRVKFSDHKISGYLPDVPLFIEMALNKGTYKTIYDLCQNKPTIVSNELQIECAVAPKEILFLLKRSHVCFDIRWRKTFLDYQFMQARKLKIPTEHQNLFNDRLHETAKRVNYIEPNFDVTNEEFFRRSERVVKRVFSHDKLHDLMKFGKEPAYFSAKVDKTKAALDPELFFSLSHETKIRIIQEEMFVLSLERAIIPALAANHPYNARVAAHDIARRLVINFLPLWQRFFMVDNFNEITDYKVDYVQTFLSHGND